MLAGRLSRLMEGGWGGDAMSLLALRTVVPGGKRKDSIRIRVYTSILRHLASVLFQRCSSFSPYPNIPGRGDIAGRSPEKRSTRPRYSL